MTSADEDLDVGKSPTEWSWVKGLLILAVVGAHLPLLSIHLLHLWQRPHFRLLPILLVVCGYLLWRRWPRSAETRFVRAPILELLLLSLSLLLLGAGVGLSSPFLGAASAIFAVGYLMISLTGIRALSSCLGAWTLLWILIPLPLGYDLALIAKLQAWTSAQASDVLDLIGIDHLMAGNVLTLCDATFFVDEACSGVHSLFALFAYAAVFVVFASRGLRRGVLLLASTIPWAMFLNVLRIVTIAICHTWWQVDLSTGWSHEGLGFLTFMVALSLTLSTDQLLGSVGFWIWTGWRSLRGWTGRRRRAPRAYSSSESSVALSAEVDRVVRRTLVPRGALSALALCLYGVLCVTQVTGAAATASHDVSWNALVDVTEELLPADVAGFDRQKFEDIERDWSSDLGLSSRVWRYAGRSMECVVSLDFPFFGWHELTRCYTGIGWQLEDRTVHSQPDDGWHLVEATFTNESGESAYLVFGFVNERGAMLTPPSQLGVQRFVDRVQQKTSVEVQVFCPSTQPLSDTDRERIQAVFRATVQRLRSNLTRERQEG